MKRGLCRATTNPDQFFVGDEDHPSQVMTPYELAVVESYCNRCPVAAECLTEALEKGYKGIWGGTNSEQRKAIRRIRTRSLCIRCKGAQLRKVDGIQLCRSC